MRVSPPFTQTTTIAIRNPNIKLGSTYTFKASYSNGISYSSFSSPFQLLALDPPLSPLRPLTLVSANTTVAQFEITPPSLSEAGGDPNPEYYIFFKEKESSDPLTPLSSHSPTSLQVIFNYADNSLSQNTIYEVVYQIKNKLASSEQLSPVALFATANVPTTPENWLNVEALSSSTVLMSWDSGVDSSISSVSLIGFEILRDNGYNTGEFKSVYTTNSLSIRKAEMSGLTSSLTYRFKLVAINQNGKSEPSTAVPIQVCGPLSFIEAPRVTSANATSVVLKWSSPLDTGGCSVSSYEVYMNDGNGGAFPDTPIASITETSYTVALTDSDLGKDYKVEIKVIGISGRSRTSGVLAFRYALIPDKPSDLIRDTSDPEAKGIALTIENTSSSKGADID